MGDNDHSTVAPGEGAAPELDKGKGKAVENPPADDVSMGEEEDESSSDESAPEDMAGDDDEEDNGEGDDKLEPISTDNIITGSRRTRGKTINFAEAAEKSQAAGDEMEDDDDDEDFQAPDDDSTMKD